MKKYSATQTNFPNAAAAETSLASNIYDDNKGEFGRGGEEWENKGGGGGGDQRGVYSSSCDIFFIELYKRKNCISQYPQKTTRLNEKIVENKLMYV